jgi:hypothetical protein
MSRFNGSAEGAQFKGKFVPGDPVVVTVDPPAHWIPRPRGVIWKAVPTRAGYIVRYPTGALIGWPEDDLRLAFGGWLRRIWRGRVRRVQR